MEAPTELTRYWAFISYSHEDEGWGRWLHRALETYRVPGRLVGRQTRAGPIPRRLMPIFRDRDEMPSSAELAATINEALRQSRFQIVICSPHAATSRWVNEEIKTFKRLGRDPRILALIVDGAPNASETPGAGLVECFPRALRYRLDTQGEIGSEKAEVVAADARKGKDGRENAKLKLIAGLLGVGFDELKQREKVRRRWQWVSRVVATVALIAAVGGLLQGQQQVHAEQEHAAHVQRLVDLGRKQLEDNEYTRAATYLSAAYAEGERSVDVHYLLARALPSVEAMTSRTFRVSEGSIARQMVYTPDGHQVLVAERHPPDKCTVHLIDVHSGETKMTLEDCPEGGEATFSADGRRVLMVGMRSMATREARTQLYDVVSGRRLLDLQGYSDAWTTTHMLLGTGGDSALSCVAILNDRRQPEIWNMQTGRKIVLSIAAVSAAISPDGTRVVTGDDHGEIVIWDARSGAERRRFSVKPAKPTAAFFTANYIATLGENGAISLWNPSTAAFEGVLSGHGSKVILVQPDRSGRRLLTAAENEPVRVWDLATQRTLFATPERQESYFGFDFSGDGHRLMALTADVHAMKIFSLDTKNQVAALDGHSGPITTGAMSPDGFHSLTVGSDGVIREWDERGLRAVPLDTWTHGAAMEKNAPSLVAWAGFDENSTVSVGSDGAVRLWPRDEGGTPLVMKGHSATIYAASLSGDSKRLITGSADHTARVWDLASGRIVASLTGVYQHAVQRVALSADGKLAATLDFVEPVAQIWNADTGEPMTTLRGHAAPPNSVRFSVDGERLLTTSGDKSAKVWDARSGRLLFSLDGHSGVVRAAVPSPDGEQIVTVSDDHSARLWSAQDGRLLRTIVVDDAGALESAVFTHDSKFVAIGADNGMVVLWDLQTGDVRRFTGLDAGYSDTVAFSPDEKLVASPSLASGEFGIWSMETGRLLVKWKDPRRYFYAVAFSPDGKRLVAAGPTKDEVADFPVFDVSLEIRTPEQIAAVIRCKSPWKVDGERLLPHQPESPNCPGLVEAPR